MFPAISTEELLKKLEIPKDKRIKMVLDTDTFNEVDDQFAIAYALNSPDRLDVQAIYAAPFDNKRSNGPEDGMLKSYDEILRLLDKMDIFDKGLVFKGSREFLTKSEEPMVSEAVNDLIDRAMKASPDDPLYVVSIAAITNVASAVLLKPEIIKNIVVVWLGGHPHYWHDTIEFNLYQDVKAAQVVFDCGVPLIQIPCMGVASHLLTTIPELKAYTKAESKIAKMLIETVSGYNDDHYAWAKEIWDISVIAYLINPDWVPAYVVHTPILSSNMTWSINNKRHFMKVAYRISRNDVFRDMFRKI